MAFIDLWPFFMSGTNFSMLFENDGNGNQIYIGWSIPGTGQNESNWRIMHQTFDGSNNVTSITWPNASTAFQFQWSARTGYTYS